jgi:hypothetical protein
MVDHLASGNERSVQRRHAEKAATFLKSGEILLTESWHGPLVPRH